MPISEGIAGYRYTSLVKRMSGFQYKDKGNQYTHLKAFKSENLDNSSLQPASVPQRIQRKFTTRDDAGHISDIKSVRTGKTAGFALVTLSRINPNYQFSQCLCLTSTFELTMEKFCVYVQVTHAARVNRLPRETLVKEQLVTGTPGNLLDWCGKLKLLDWGKVKVFVLEKADDLIDAQQYSKQSVRIQRALSPDCQMHFFSAKFGDPVLWVAPHLVPDPNSIKLTQEKKPEMVKGMAVCQRSCDAPRKALTTGPVLMMLYTKTRAVMCQPGYENILYPVKYGDKKILPGEKHLSVIVKECFDIVWT
ncbi:hypothetical protein JRQ81_012552 [Phrynocephalus forsythii]|uniref:DEAD/DEAH-box helicase domain-containing protein n=1 Tax=Phrynocephalus forsythii TaxID=171643 RepID=A0A9Q0Y1B4_9SAUR|nr:hypothetical protein JRQ81_012552 [Phrynocephalus forsythii]